MRTEPYEPEEEMTDEQESVEYEETFDSDVPEFYFSELTAESDVDLVTQGIEEKYDFTPTRDYVVDLIQFVSDMMKGSADAAQL